MIVCTNHLLSGRELANRWGRSESAIGLASAIGVGPRYIKIGGALKYPLDEVKRYERACLLVDGLDVPAQTTN